MKIPFNPFLKAPSIASLLSTGELKSHFNNTKSNNSGVDKLSSLFCENVVNVVKRQHIIHNSFLLIQESFLKGYIDLILN